MISDVARRLIKEDYFLQRCGKRIPIIIQDLEFTWYVLEATKKVNIHDEAHDFFKALESGNIEEAKTLFSQATKKIDQACSKGVIVKNTAARKKSNMAKKLNAMNA